MKKIILNIENKINSGEEINLEDINFLAKLDNEKDLNELFNAANRIRKKFNGDKIDLCSIMNAKSGRCSENCKFCAQSVYYKTNVSCYGLVKEEDVMKLAKENEESGINRFSLVTSGRGLKGEEFHKVLDIYIKLRKKTKLNLCASLGILAYDELVKLKETGVTMYHHNLETSREYYEKICTTHSYDERIETIKSAKKAGLNVCSGGIIGMGESMEDRIKLASLLKKLEIKSIPINVLNPINGTPLENIKTLSQKDILKTMAIFRFINPTAYIRLAGGRNLIDNFGEKCFSVGVNASISGNYLTTSGNKIVDDIEMINRLGLKVNSNE